MCQHVLAFQVIISHFVWQVSFVSKNIIACCNIGISLCCKSIGAVDAEFIRKCGDSKCLPALAAVMDDSDVDVRLNLAAGLVNLTAMVEGAEALVACGYVKLLVRKAGKDADVDVQKRSLVVLNKCTNVIGGRGLSDSLAHGAVRCCIGLLGHRDASVRHLAAFNLASLAFSPEGKVHAIKGGGVPVLLKLMTDRDENVRASSAAAIMGVVTDDSGKVAVIEAGIGSLVSCLQDTNTLVTLNTLKVCAVAFVCDGCTVYNMC